VSMTPDDVREQTFKERFKGYDVEEVDAFLERVMDALAELYAEREELTQHVEELQARLAARPADQAHVPEATPAPTTPADAAPAPAQPPEPVSSDLVSRTLITAQRAADETIARAQQEAERLVGEAQGEAARRVEDAQRHISAERERLETEAERVARVAEGLVRFRAEYRARVEQVISDQLALLERTDLPDVPDGLRELTTFTPDAEPAAPLPTYRELEPPSTPGSAHESLTELAGDPAPPGDDRSYEDDRPYEPEPTEQMQMPTEGHVGEA
jgi:DivIVA domain-containing protein